VLQHVRDPALMCNKATCGAISKLNLVPSLCKCTFHVHAGPHRFSPL